LELNGFKRCDLSREVLSIIASTGWRASGLPVRLILGRVRHRVGAAAFLNCPDQPRTSATAQKFSAPPFRQAKATMRDDYIASARKVIDDPNILINVVSRRVKQLRRGSRPLVESLEKLSPEDTALREIAEGKITYEIATPEELARSR